MLSGPDWLQLVSKGFLCFVGIICFLLLSLKNNFEELLLFVWLPRRKEGLFKLLLLVALWWLSIVAIMQS